MRSVIITSISLLLFCSFTSEDEFQKVKNAPRNVSLKKKLQVFEKNGIERTIDVSDQITADSIIHIAYNYLHTPHRMGGTTRKGIDCSGLIYATFRQAGIDIPRTSNEQARYGHIIADKTEFKKGDLLYFYNSYNSRNLITHTGIYIGNGKFIHTSHSSGVTVSSIAASKYWRSRLLFGTRFIETISAENETDDMPVMETDSMEVSY